MTKLGAVFWLGLVVASGSATYSVKYAVQRVDDQLQYTRKQIVADEQDMRVLTAEWDYLNRPARLADLNQRFLHLAPIGTQQLEQKISDIPLRAPAVAEAMPTLPADTSLGALITLTGTAPTTPKLPITAAAYRPAVAAGLPVRLVEAARAPVRCSSPCPSAAEREETRPAHHPESVPAAAAVAAPVSLNALFAQVAEKR